MKIAVVTGTSRGLGESIAKDLLAEGYKVVGVSRSKSCSALLANPNFVEYLFDLSNIQGIPALCSTLVEEQGIPYALVNNSALGLDGLLATQRNDEIELVIAVNMTAPILLTKYLSRHMLEKREGRIVNISSVVASTGYKGLSVYAATKASMLGFTRSLSRELGSRNITVNALQPGFMETAMSDGIPDPAMDKIRRRSALGRIPEVADVSAAVVYLLGDGGSNITGQTLIIDAGNSA
jgi:3-oxoacyl-[acyl-carrier protein] reductase